MNILFINVDTIHFGDIDRYTLYTMLNVDLFLLFENGGVDQHDQNANYVKVCRRSISYCPDSTVDTDTPDQLLTSVTTEMLGKYFDDTAVSGGSVAEWLACWTQAQKGPGSNRRRDAVG